MPLIGREQEKDLLEAKASSGKSEFIAVYGRRRVGKTFLIRSVFGPEFSFQLTGIANATLTQQLTNFNLALKKFNPGYHEPPPNDWITAFSQLTHWLETNGAQKKVIFFDEMPWLDTPKSGFLIALEHFWNSWASARMDVILIVCGSAASWMLHKLINNRGGLHNRVTMRMKIHPFTLFECESYLKAKNAEADRYQVLQLYMAFGGIPFYWEEVIPSQSAAQNINNICFTENGLLKREFQNLFSSLFKNWEKHQAIIEALATKAMGLTREEILTLAGLPNAGSSTRLLDELEESGFIKKFLPFGKKSRSSLYQLTDFFCLFYLKFMKDLPEVGDNYWLQMIDHPQHRAWSGYAFEQVCLYHTKQIKEALGISGIQTSTSSWRNTGAGKGAQIDLLIDRRDHAINLCEMKFSISQYTITAKYAEELRNKLALFKNSTGTKKALFLTFVTSFGVTPNNQSIGLVQHDLTMEALFAR